MRRLILGIVVSVLTILFIPYIIVPVYAEPYITEVINELSFIVVEADNETFPGGCYEITLYAEFAAYRDENNLSYYELGTDTYTLIFDGPEGGNGYIEPPLTRTFVADSEFGLSMVTPEGHRYCTETDRNPDAPEQHAKVYKNPEEPCMFLIGFENLYGGGDRDYNDMVFSLRLQTPQHVIPEVPFGTVLSCLIMFIGFIGFVGFKRFRPWQK